MSALSRGGVSAAGAIAGGIGGAGPALATGFGGALGPIGLALGLGVAAMVYAAYQDAAKAEEQRRATGKEAVRVLDADRQRINETLRQQGIEVDPLSGMSKEVAGRATPTLAERDKVEAAIDASRAAGWGLTPDQQERMLARWGGASVPQMSGGAGPRASFAPGAAAGAGGSAVPRATPASQDLGQLLASRELRVRVVNPKEIGGGSSSGGALGGGAPVPGWVPR